MSVPVEIYLLRGFQDHGCRDYLPVHSRYAQTKLLKIAMIKFFDFLQPLTLYQGTLVLAIT